MEGGFIMKRAVLFFVLFFLLLTPVRAFASGQIFLQGIEAFIRGDYAQAVESFHRVTRLKEDFVPEAHYFKVLSLFRSNDLQGARRAHEELRLTGYDYAQLYLQWGKIYLNLEGHWAEPDLARALEELEKSKALGMDTGELYGLLGSTNYSLGNLEEALLHYQRAVTRNPSSHTYHSILARIFQDLGDDSRAVHHLERSLALEPKQEGLMVNLANLYYEQDRILDFKRLYREAIEENPTRFSLRQEYGIRLYQLGSFEEALLELEEAIRLNPRTYLPYYYLGMINEERGATGAAMEYYETALRYNPNYTDAFLAIGDILLEESPYRAMSFYYEALEKSPNYVPAHYSLAKAYQQMGLYQSAVDKLLRALELDPTNLKAQELLNELLR